MSLKFFQKVSTRYEQIPSPLHLFNIKFNDNALIYKKLY